MDYFARELAICHLRLTIDLVFATLSGVMWFLACPDFDLWPLAWIAMIPMLYAVERASKISRVLLIGAWTGLIAIGGGFYWMFELLRRFGGIPAPLAAVIFVLFAAYQGAVFVLFAWGVFVIRRRRKFPMAFIGPPVMVAAEMVVPMLFPWYLAITQAWQTRVIQIAELTGPVGVTALLLAVNGAIYDLITDRRRATAPALITLMILGGALVYGEVRIRQVLQRRNSAPQISAGIVQPNIPLGEKGLEPESQLAQLHQRSAELQAMGAELILWPETAYPYPISRGRSRDWRESDPRRIRRGFEAPLLFGAVSYDRENPQSPYNSAILLDPDGSFRGSFDKIHLLLFGEYLPGFPVLRRFLPATTMQFQSGTNIRTLSFNTSDGRPWRIGPMICYEDIIPRFGRKLARLHPHLLVNLTNDAWFGDTSEPWEHLALSVYRAVELRTDLVRAVNTGVSAFVDASGRVYAHGDVVDPSIERRGAEKLFAPVALMEGGRTVYAAIGDVFGYGCLLATAILLFIAARVSRGSGSSWPASSRRQ